MTGAGIFVSYSTGTGVYSSTGAQPNNSYAMIYNGITYYNYQFDMYCCSNTTSSSGSITIPSGHTYSSNYWYGRIYRYSGSNTYAGCVQLQNYYNCYCCRLQLSSSYAGIHTCNIPDDQGNELQVSIAIHNQIFYSK